MDLALNNLQRLICHKTQPPNHSLQGPFYLILVSDEGFILLFNKTKIVLTYKFPTRLFSKLSIGFIYQELHYNQSLSQIQVSVLAKSVNLKCHQRNGEGLIYAVTLFCGWFGDVQMFYI